MNKIMLSVTIVALLTLSACDKPTVVNVPAETVVVPVPGPAGPAGEAGETGQAGENGVQGETGDTTIIIAPEPETAPVTPAE